MKKQILVLIAFMLFFATVKAQVISDEDVTGTVMILDSTLVPDYKLQLVADRLYSEGGLINMLNKAASNEKAETGKIEKANAYQNFIEKINKDYQNLAMKYLKVDTVYIDTVKLNNQIKKIQTWQQSVLNDPEIKDATSLSIWEQKGKRLEKLLYYKKQIK